MLTFRKANAKDAYLLSRLHSETFLNEAWEESWFKKEASNSNKRFFLAETPAGEIVGMLVLSVVLDEAEILTIGVSLRYRGQGIAKALLQMAYQEKIGSLHLEVAADNTAAINLYQSEQFSQIGRRPNYYSNGADALLMMRDI